MPGWVVKSVAMTDRPRGIERVEAHCPFARSDAVDVRTPIGMEMLGGLVLHPARETFVQPKVVPPRHGDEVAEPLVRHFMRFGAVDAVALTLCGDRRVVEQRIFEGEYRAPILHRAEELRLTRASDIVELRQWVGRAKIVVVEGKDLGL